MTPEQEKRFYEIFPMPPEWSPTPTEPVYDLEVRRHAMKAFISSLLKEERARIAQEIMRGGFAKVADDNWNDDNTIGYQTAQQEIAYWLTPDTNQTDLQE